MRLRMATILSVAIVALGATSALGRYGLQGDPDIAAWFQRLRSPNTGLSCCDQSDGHILADRDWRIVGDTYEVNIQGAWVAVPANTVLSRIPNPTGGAVVFYHEGTHRIYCFVRAPEA